MRLARLRRLTFPVQIPTVVRPRPARAGDENLSGENEL